MKHKFTFFLKYYLPALIVAGLIFFFSSIPSLQYALHSTAEEIVLRKAAHFVEFAILSFFLWRIFYGGYKFYPRYAFFWALILAALYGASDEFHQTFVTGRTGKIIDAFFDAFSALFFLECLVIFVSRKMTWKNLTILLLTSALLIGLEVKMISETSSFKVSFEKIKLDLKYTVQGEWDYIRGIKKQSSESVDVENMPASGNSEKKEITVGGEKPVENIATPEEASIAKVVPDEISVSVPFASQAPLGVWDAVHEEACEEASLVMLKYYADQKELTPKIAEKEIQEMVKFEIKNYGDYKDTSAVETAKLAGDFYALKNLKVIYDFSVSDLKKYLSLGKPIIVPASGRALNNPFYTPPGPLYHNLVLIGYSGDKIITNDPGTKRGEGYAYDMDTLYNAIHDFPGKAEDIDRGRKAMRVVE